MTAVVRLHKDGDVMGISTDALTEEAFYHALIPALSKAIEDYVPSPEREGFDVEFQFERWIPQIVEIACKLRGYKADVQEHRVLVAGDFYPDDVVTNFARKGGALVPVA